MLDKLFNSKTRVHILQVFFRQSPAALYAQEIIKQTRGDAANTFRELQKLTKLGVLTADRQGGKKYYALNANLPYYAGLAAIFRAGEQHEFLSTHPWSKRAQETLLKGKEWYHQRFDGCPMFIAHIAESEVRREARKPAGTEADVRVCFYATGKADWYLDQADIQRGARVMIGLARRDPDVSRNLLGLWRGDEENFDRYFAEEFPKLDLAGLDDEALRRAWERYNELALRRFTSSSIIDHFALGTDELIRTMLRKEIFSSRQGKSLSTSEFTNIFTVATAPIHQSFINQAEVDLLKIALGRSAETLAAYQRRYFWIHNNYVSAHVLDVPYFRRELKAWKLSKRNLKTELANIAATGQWNGQKKATLLRKFHLSAELRTLLTVSEDFTWWQDERKKATYLNIHMGCQFLREIGRRTGYTVEELKYAVPSEASSLLRGSGPTRRELQQRTQGSVLMATREGYWVGTGPTVKQAQVAMFGSKMANDVQDIRGLSASLGRAIGTVKVMQSVTEMNKIQPGDILVAVMTRPDYVPAMRKAAAIVTDEGGITSHAAIVSRELGIPCIIGTKIATQVFKDGDLVEVNANHGWVRKVQA